MDQLHFSRVHVAGSRGMLGAAVAGELELAGHELLHATAPSTRSSTARRPADVGA